MIVIIGFIVVFGAVAGGFIWSGGHLLALIHPAELLTIGGAALGAMIVMSPKKVLIDLLHGLLQCVKGTPYNRVAYDDLFKTMYDLFRFARREGLTSLEPHLNQPENSDIFKKYPRITGNHHVMEFIRGALSPVIEGSARPEQLPGLLETEIRVIEEEHHAPLGVLTKTADGLPGFGIVAAVLGIVITMASIDGPVEEIGEKVGAALVGTFLGILMSYGVFGPLAVRLEFLGAAELSYFRTIATIVQGFATDLPPKIAIENARRGVGSEYRPTRDQLDELFSQVDAAR
jgi:chemotaxis protein MotA